jgi:hypothetical protein
MKYLLAEMFFFKEPNALLPFGQQKVVPKLTGGCKTLLH